jgi:transcriptional regulator with XRE-family HTH domain
MNFPENLIKLRKRYKIPQERLAELLNRSGSAISNWEKNINSPDLESLIFLRDHFKIDLETLIMGDVYQFLDELEKKSKIPDPTEGCMMAGGCALRRIAIMENRLEEVEKKK